MPVNDDFINDNLILDHAQALVAARISIIPLVANSKRAAVGWKSFQSRIPDQRELTGWFAIKGYTGIGIVTGSVSRLAVLDFDNPTLYSAFCEKFPVLGRTYTVQTPRGYHLYYRLPKRILLKTRQVPGIDLQVEGRYVVAPPTQIDGHTYTVSEPFPPVLLSTDAQKRVMAFFDTYMNVGVSLSDKSLESPTRPLKIDSAQNSSLSVEKAIGTYYRLAVQRGRNNALFQVALMCRDEGWSQQRSIDVLVQAHVNQLTPTGHRRETPDQREQEARGTIVSVYSRSPRSRPRTQPHVSRLPNSIREALLARDGTAILRTLEGLQLVGIKPGSPFTEAQARALLCGIVGAHSIRKALVSGLFTPPTTPKPLCTANTPSGTTSKNAYFDRFAKPKRNRGQPQKYYVLPSVEDLCTNLNVSISAGDTITLHDLCSVKTYRAALHREHIRRRPGQYSRKLLADRLSKSVDSIRRYDRLANVRVTPMYKRIPLNWDNLSILPGETDPIRAGVFLEDHTGQRYPVKYGLACKLLAQGKTLACLEQEVNHYAVDEGTPLPPRYQLEQQHIGPDQQALGQYWRTVYQYEPVQIVAEQPHPTPIPRRGVVTIEPPTAANDLTQATGQTSRHQIAYWAERIHTTITAQSSSPEQYISRQNALDLVQTYGIRAVKLGLWILNQREDVENPAGFLIVVIRSSRKAR